MPVCLLACCTLPPAHLARSLDACNTAARLCLVPRCLRCLLHRATFDEFLKAFFCVLFAALGLAQAQVIHLWAHSSCLLQLQTLPEPTTWLEPTPLLRCCLLLPPVAVTQIHTCTKHTRTTTHQMSFPDLAKAQGALQRVFPIIDRRPAIDSADPGGAAPDTRGTAGQLVLSHVVFAYPSRPQVKVFNNFCLTIPAGAAVLRLWLQGWLCVSKTRGHRVVANLSLDASCSLAERAAWCWWCLCCCRQDRGAGGRVRQRQVHGGRPHRAILRCGG